MNEKKSKKKETKTLESAFLDEFSPQFSHSLIPKNTFDNNVKVGIKSKLRLDKLCTI